MLQKLQPFSVLYMPDLLKAYYFELKSATIQIKSG